mgnify:FL=1
MRKGITGVLLALALTIGAGSRAQYDRDYFYYVGRSFMIDNNFEDAIRTLNILLRFDDDAYEGYFLRGIAKYNLDDLLGAEADFTTAIEKNPVFTTAFTYRAITRSRLGNYDDALSDFAEAIELRPDLPNAYYSRGVTRLLNQQFREAIDDFDKFIRQENKVSDAYLNRGVCYLYLKDTTQAYADFETAIRTNRENPMSYNRRGELEMKQQRYKEAEADFDMAIRCDSNYLLSYFNRAIVRSQIGDYNRALEDYDKVAFYSPENVLVYYNRAGIQAQLGNIESAVEDYSKAIELYPDFANAYLNRSRLRYLLKDESGSRRDRDIAQRKIAEYKTRLSDSTYSIYADTTHRFDRLLSFDANVAGSTFGRIASKSADNRLALLPLFRFTLRTPDSLSTVTAGRYHSQREADFRRRIDNRYLTLTARESNVPADSLVMLDKRYARELMAEPASWELLFQRGITQTLIKQYTNAVGTFTSAIDQYPANPFLYLNRSTTRAEMIDFISSIDNSYQRITIESDPAKRLQNSQSRTYNYDEAIADLNKAAKLYPDFPYTYYNRANLMALSGKLPEAYNDYTKAIELNPAFAEAYYNRGLVQIFMKDTRKGCLDMSKAGELGIPEAYEILKQYTALDR